MRPASMQIGNTLNPSAVVEADALVDVDGHAMVVILFDRGTGREVGRLRLDPAKQAGRYVYENAAATVQGGGGPEVHDTERPKGWGRIGATGIE